jgi:hypothetical protein
MKNFIPLTALTVALLALSVFFRKLSVDRIHPYQLQIVAGAIYALEVPLWLWLIKREGITSYDPMGVMWGTLCILTAVATAVLFSYLLKHSPSPSLVAMAVATNPLGVLLLTRLFLGEEITLKKLLGCGVTIVGLFLLT